MLLIPFEMPPGSTRGPVVVVLILEKENMDRMRLADPLDFQLRQLCGRIGVNRPIADLDIVVAYEEDTNKLMEFRNKQDIAGLVEWLERGRQIKREDLHAPLPLRKT